MSASICHVVHFVYRLAIGGMENVVLQIVNDLPRESFRHTIIAITDVEPELVKKIKNSSVNIVELKKPPGQPWRLYPKVFRLLRRIRPDVVHSCNIAAMEFLPVVALAGVPLRVHVEHGMDIREISGQASHYQWLRRLYKPFVSRYIAVSTRETGIYRRIGVPIQAISVIPNGVDTKVFRPREATDALPVGFPFEPGRDWVVGTVGRQAEIKNPLLLVEAFISLVKTGGANAERARLVLVGDGPLNGRILERIREAQLENRVWLPGGRSDVAVILRVLDCFVLPSLSEATSCALLEAMATGLPVIATDVGGNAEILENGVCGSLFPSGDHEALVAHLRQHLNAGSARPRALTALASVRKRYDLTQMLENYSQLFLGK